MATFTVRGHRVRSTSNRRFVLWVYFTDDRKPEILKRSDSLNVLRQDARRRGYWAGSGYVILDQTTGEEVSA